MAEDQKNSENETTEQQAELEEKISSYEKLLDRLKRERWQVEKELSNDYRNARRYVRAHPEEGIIFSFLGGVALGIILGKLTK